MRFILIMVALVGAGFWGFGKFKEAFSGETARETLRKTNPSLGLPPPPSGPGNSVSASIAQSITIPQKEILPRATRRVAFDHRSLPDDATITQLSAMGLVVISDPATRSLLLSGPVDLVEDVAHALRTSDMVPGSCAVQTFAVYVSKKAVKGFDLAAAISEASTGSYFGGSLGGGSATFDIRLGDLTALLDFIADGEVVEVVQRPHIRLLDRVAASVEAIDEIPIPSTSVSQGISQSSIDYRKVGLQLRIVPTFLSGGRVRLEVLQQNGVIGQTVRIDANEIPVVQTQSVSSAVEMSVGQTLVFGGVRTFRHGTKKGLLGSKEVVEEGALYVILSTYSDVPKAIAVAPPIEFPDSPWVPSPGLPPSPDGFDWIDGQLLPPKGVLPSK